MNLIDLIVTTGVVPGYHVVVNVGCVGMRQIKGMLLGP